MKLQYLQRSKDDISSGPSYISLRSKIIRLWATKVTTREHDRDSNKQKLDCCSNSSSS